MIISPTDGDEAVHSSLPWKKEGKKQRYHPVVGGSWGTCRRRQNSKDPANIAAETNVCRGLCFLLAEVRIAPDFREVTAQRAFLWIRFSHCIPKTYFNLGRRIRSSRSLNHTLNLWQKENKIRCSPIASARLSSHAP
jgi:hypothetical protein